MALAGSSEEEINEMIMREDECAGSLGSFSVIHGNLSEEFRHPQYMAVCTAFDVFSACCGMPTLLVYHSPPTSPYDINDEGLEVINNNNDFSYHASEAFISSDPNPPGWGQSLGLPIERDSEKALDFWHWWLFQAIPQAWHTTTIPPIEPF